ncbi:capsule polysaccharide transporter [Ketogulonicigenium vulgare]|uniref:Capsule polysaccharide export protein-like protein n=1 Tax=Ketogulonicigenium vulgare (strain WSH-001) TaxID=759362 RepID=F9Y4X1_KETVW|nr:capsule polysaccharide transporter [Ketogulonicigenium vulgare]ADO43579.1 putative polysaccharide export-assoiated protein [Ketogulonicigenium vulgare Y25]AEM41855.1 Capsule polysaccharide export protein-like protein [Ketogulonicigenium vulgare WSH-001]ALJ81961.1 capsule biosynthesis protein [Ketogulonicigenium vulgare]ANW34599.1 capsule biosynthesis protein [Ketogulonicigenium vulgare]AOZ55613.1 polysaccharide export-assoiated protein [Ketogulonicigenium vulgare]
MTALSPHIPDSTVESGAAPRLEAAITLARLPQARVRRRHIGLALAYLLMVVLPLALTGGYLWLRAADQYATPIAFAITLPEQASSAGDMLGGWAALTGTAGGSTQRDSDMLYEFLRSPALVAALDAQLDLRQMFARATPRDPVFGFHPSGTIEDLTRYWQRMVHVRQDPASGLIFLRVQAFDPGDAQRIADAILAQSQRVITDVAALAHADATDQAASEVTRSLERLITARADLAAFRARNQMIDPAEDVLGQMSILQALQAQAASAMIDRDMLLATAAPGDPRLAQAQLRIDTITARIGIERAQFGEDHAYVALLTAYERLVALRDFAQSAYLSALAAQDVARAEAARQSRFVAPFIPPAPAERSEYPQRWLIWGLTAFFCNLTWAIGVLIYYALRDRK